VGAVDKRERVDAALSGQPVDTIPISCWGHDYLREWTAEGLAQAMLDNYRRYDWDYMKVNPRASYHVEDWGAELRPSGVPNAGPIWIRRAVTAVSDWRALRPLAPDHGTLGEQLDALRLIRDDLAGEAYFIQTIFSPLSIAKYLVGNDPAPVKAAMADDPGALRAALDVITETFITYSLASLEAGATGIFFATTGWAARDMLSEDEYRRWGHEYDVRVLEAVKDRGRFNVLHNCGAGVFFDLIADYPVHAISWAATLPGNPSLAEGRARTERAVMGGISEKTTLPDGTPDAVASEVLQAISQTNGLRLLLAPGCSIPPWTPPANLAAAATAARGA
jgi:uroporphyrinogen decarboxylase